MKKLRFLHIAFDRHKFINAVYRIFNEDERLENHYLFLNEEGTKAIQAGDYDVAYFHSLPDRAWQLLKLVPKDKSIIWWAWGYDVNRSDWNLRPLMPPRFKPITKRLKRDAFGILYRLKKPLKWIYGMLFVERYRKEVLHRVDYYQPVLAYEWKIMRNLHKDFRAKLFLVPYSHPTLNHDSSTLSTQSILLGNSGSFGCNHLDVIEVLDKAGFKDKQFIVPLSYGQSHRYMDRVKHRLETSSLNFRILDQYLPIQDYQKLMASCRFVVNGTMMQAAIGNIGFALRNGVKVFLWRDSMLYHHYQEIGLKVFAIDDINSHSFDEPLSEEDSQHNIDVMNKSHENLDKVYNQVINELLLKYNDEKIDKQVL